jgi:hypothetical protein
MKIIPAPYRKDSRLVFLPRVKKKIAGIVKTIVTPYSQWIDLEGARPMRSRIIPATASSVKSATATASAPL